MNRAIIYNEYHIRSLLLRSDIDFNKFTKNELIDFLEVSRKDTEKYKARCKKAIDFINSTGYGTDFSMSAEEVDKVFNILCGSDSNEK